MKIVELEQPKTLTRVDKPAEEDRSRKDMRENCVTKQYQLIQVASDVLRNYRAELEVTLNAYHDKYEIIWTRTNNKPSLVYVEPDVIYEVISQLGDIKVQGVVLPDYVFAKLATESKSYGFDPVGVEVTDKPTFTSLAGRFISDCKEQELSSILEQLGASITAIDLRQDGVSIRLYGSGLIAVSGPESVFNGKLVEVLQQLTNLIMQFLDKLEIGSESSHTSSKAERISKPGKEQERSFWGRIIPPAFRSDP
jgi:hypothetical protein